MVTFSSYPPCVLAGSCSGYREGNRYSCRVSGRMKREQGAWFFHKALTAPATVNRCRRVVAVDRGNSQSLDFGMLSVREGGAPQHHHWVLTCQSGNRPVVFRCGFVATDRLRGTGRRQSPSFAMNDRICRWFDVDGSHRRRSCTTGDFPLLLSHCVHLLRPGPCVLRRRDEPADRRGAGARGLGVGSCGSGVR